ncbi:hypothetical protein BDEG_28114 [Batrachochytrium dendrobatidis JEL423]|nr:hypothetical protein BDEG_28114 [Batrachochytrium dendrobatidis JEL423]
MVHPHNIHSPSFDHPDYDPIRNCWKVYRRAYLNRKRDGSTSACQEVEISSHNQHPYLYSPYLSSTRAISVVGLKENSKQHCLNAPPIAVASPSVTRTHHAKEYCQRTQSYTAEPSSNTRNGSTLNDVIPSVSSLSKSQEHCVPVVPKPKPAVQIICTPPVTHSNTTTGRLSLTAAHDQLALLEYFIDLAVQMICTLNTVDMAVQPTAPTRLFVIEVLRRCPASFSTTAIALLYLHRLIHELQLPCVLSNHCNESRNSKGSNVAVLDNSNTKYTNVSETSITVLSAEVEPANSKHANIPRKSRCGRRAFVAALLTAHKYLEDFSLGTKEWASRLSLKAKDLHASETTLLNHIHHNLVIQVGEYDVWVKTIVASSKSSSNSSASC